MRRAANWFTCLLLTIAIVGCGGGGEKGKDKDGTSGGGDKVDVADNKPKDDGKPKDDNKPGDDNKPADDNKPGDDNPKPVAPANVSDSGALAPALKYLNDGVLMAGVLHPKRATESAVFQALPADLDLGEMQENSGFDVRNANRILFLVHAPNAEEKAELEERLENGNGFGGGVKKESFDEPDFDFEGKTDEEIDAYFEEQERKREEERKQREEEESKKPVGMRDASYVIWLSDPIDRDEYLAARESWQPIVEVQIGDVTAHRIHSREAVIIAEDGLTIWGGPIPSLEAMLAAKEGAGKVYDRLSAVSGSFDAAFAFDVTEYGIVKEMMKAELTGFGGPGAAIEGVVPGAIDTAMKVGAGTIRVDASQAGTLATIQIAGVEENDYAEIQAKLGGALGLGKGLFASMAMPNLTKQTEGTPFAPGVKLLNDLVQGVTVADDAGEVLITIPHPEGTAEFVRTLEPFILEQQKVAKLQRFRNNLRYAGLGFHNYHDTYGSFPAAAAYATADDAPLLSWRVAMAPYAEASQVYEEINKDEAWDSEHNKAFVNDMPEMYASPGVEESGMTTLMVITGPGTVFPNAGRAVAEGETLREGLRFRDITDGSSNTILAVFAAPDKAVPWTKPADLVFDPENPLACVGEIPETGLMVLMCDGSFHTLPKDIDPVTFANLVNPGDGNVVDLPR